MDIKQTFIFKNCKRFLAEIKNSIKQLFCKHEYYETSYQFNENDEQGNVKKHGYVCFCIKCLKTINIHSKFI